MVKCKKCGRINPTYQNHVDDGIMCNKCFEEFVDEQLMKNAIGLKPLPKPLEVTFARKPAWQDQNDNRAIITIPKKQVRSVDMNSKYDIIMRKIDEEERK
jgi:hypothetical protein